MRALPSLSLSAWSGANSSSLYGFLSVMSPHGSIVTAAAACHDTGLSIGVALQLLFRTEVSQSE